MNPYLTIGELSKLMNVSIHQIRYFEEKEILFPSYIDNNQYRMYGIDEIYQLAHILLLRKLNIPVSTINQSMNKSATNDYQLLLEKSLNKINSEINQLIMLQQFIQKVLKEHADYGNMKGEYQIKHVDNRYLKKWLVLEDNETITARSLYEKRPQYHHLFETDLHYVYDSEQVTLCFETIETTPAPDIVLEKGCYLYKAFFVTDDQDVDHEIAKLEHFLNGHHYMVLGPIIILEKSYLSMFNNDKLHYELQIQIEHALDDTTK
ncbi:MerR family transcriptional regulator [Paenibacillus odorifer]|uniref:MerR family transcriptional regulator n=1 Tax=Paenibacillus odorifer TaxID=189426 RepID=UPI00096F7673|nr:MerR family transcriptional regulator [Paenibacillus odorifer]